MLWGNKHAYLFPIPKRIMYVKLAAANFRFQSAASGIYSHCNFLNYILLIQGCQSSALISFLKLPRHPRSCLRNCWLQHRQPEGRAVSLSPSSQSRCCHLNAAVIELFPIAFQESQTDCRVGLKYTFAFKYFPRLQHLLYTSFGGFWL